MASRLLTSVAESGHHPRVVNIQPLLTPTQTDILYEWIEDGAHWPDNPAGFLQPRPLPITTEVAAPRATYLMK